MEILATHLGTDLDALAATLAAHKLHPEARLYFPGSHGEAVRRLLAAGLLGPLPEVAAGEVDPHALTRLILVDVRQRRRIGAAADWLEANPAIEVWAYDHHPDAEGDVPASGGVVDAEAGSSSTILAEQLWERGLALSDVEASLLLCGLFQDTGSLTYATTGPRDFAAAAWLLGQGGDLALVRRFAVQELGREPLILLSRMLDELEVHPLAGHRVGIAVLDLPEYVEGVAPLVSRALDLCELPVLFVLLAEGDHAGRVTVIGRGDLPGFHLGEALAPLGGGGHATAGSARIKGETVLAVRESLLGLLADALPPGGGGRDFTAEAFAAVGGPLDRRQAQERTVHERVGHLVRRLPHPVRRLLDAAALVCGRLGTPAYAVGGFVRDLLLLRANRDLDLLVEGDGPRFAEELARELSGTVRPHGSFLTAEITLPGGDTLDVATARREVYHSPAALPEVQASALRQDLFRRDFTINALAIRLGPGGPPELVDFFGGRRDLAHGHLRVLHSLSFRDDPTRALRGVRLEARLGFRLAAETEKLLGVALAEGVFDLLSGSRLTAELELLLDDPGVALAGLDRLAELGLLAVLHPRLVWTPELAGQLRDAQAAFNWYRLDGLTRPRVSLFRLLLAVLSRSLPDDEERERLCRRLLLVGEARAVLTAPLERTARAAAAIESAASRPHEIDEALAALTGEEVLLLFAAASDEARARVRHALTDLAGRSLAVRGADLVAWGVTAGPEIGRALKETRRALLDGRVGEGREEQIEFALGVLALTPGPSPETGEGNPLPEKGAVDAEP